MLRTAGRVRGLAGCGLLNSIRMRRLAGFPRQSYTPSENRKRTETISLDSGYSEGVPARWITWTSDAKNHTNFFPMRFFASNANPLAAGALGLPQPGRQQVSGRKTVLAAADNAAFRKAFSRVFRVDTF